MGICLVWVFQEKDASENTEALSKEELGRLVASRWTRDNTGQQTGEVDDGKDDRHEISEEAPDDAHDEEYEGYESESEDDSQKYNEDDEEEDHVEDFEEEKHDDFSSPYRSVSDDELDVSGLQLLLQCLHANMKPFFIVSFCSYSHLKLANVVI